MWVAAAMQHAFESHPLHMTSMSSINRKILTSMTFARNEVAMQHDQDQQHQQVSVKQIYPRKKNTLLLYTCLEHKLLLSSCFFLNDYKIRVLSLIYLSSSNLIEFFFFHVKTVLIGQIKSKNQFQMHLPCREKKKDLGMFSKGKRIRRKSFNFNLFCGYFHKKIVYCKRW